MQPKAEPGFLARNRTIVLVASTLLFLPPLAAIVQLTGDERFCGTWCPKMFFVWHQGQTWSGFATRIVRSYMGVALVAGILTTTYFFGRHWCSHLCPVGGFMELGSKLVPRWLKIDFSSFPAPAFRYGVLAVYILAPALALGSLGCSYCHFGTVPRLAGAAFSPADAAYFLRTTGLISLALVLLLGLFARGGRAYCNLLCPVGALDAISNAIGARFGRRRVRVASSRCTGCGKCAKTCSLSAISVHAGTALIDPLSCMPCRQCQTTCAQGAITYDKDPQ
jgi:polyferredoxin